MKRYLFLALLLCSFWGLTKIDFTSAPPGCPFCNKEILEKQMVYQGELASVIRTHKSAVEGHLLVISNRHVEMYDELTKEEIDEIGSLIQKIHTPQYLLIQKNGKLSGQSVPHVHVHFLPRTEDVSMVSFLFKFMISPYLKASE